MDGLLLASSMDSGSDRSSVHDDADGSSVDESVASSHSPVCIHPMGSLRQAIAHHTRFHIPPDASPLPEEKANKRLQDLSHHLQHLHELYAQELGREKAEARESFLQKMCTSSITLLRHCTSRSKFYTAVRALLCQYVPASDAKLIQIEPARDDQVFLVLPDEQVYDVDIPVGIAGHAVQALQQKLAVRYSDEFSASHSSSISSINGTSIHVAPSEPPWLAANSDCVYPSANGHLLLLFPVSSARHASYDRSVDLHLRKREVSRKSHLLVMVLKDTNGKPVGVIEALLTKASQDQVEFLDAFGVILASALETRLVICRSILETIRIRIAPESNATTRISKRKALPFTKSENETPVLALPLSDRSNHNVLVFGKAAVRQAHDRIVLEALKQPLTGILNETHSTKCRLESYESLFTACEWLRVQPADTETGKSPLAICRGIVESFLEKIVHHNRENYQQRIQVRILFQTESKESFMQIYGADHGSSFDESDPNLTSIQGQFAMLQQGIQFGEESTPSERVLIIPIRMHDARNNNESEINKKLEESRCCEAAIMIICPSCCTQSPEVCDVPLLSMIRQHITPCLVWFVQSVLWKLRQDTVHTLMIQDLNDLEGQQQELEHELTHYRLIQLLSDQLRVCISLDDFVVCVNSFTANGTMLGLNSTKFTLFVSTKKGEDKEQITHEHSSIWTIDVTTREKIFQYSTGVYLKPSDACIFSIPIRNHEHDLQPCLGILELSFHSMRERDEFCLKNELIIDKLERMLGDFITIHERMNEKEQHFYQIQQLANEEHALHWDRWTSFVQACSSLPSCFDAWLEEIAAPLLSLVPSSDFVNIFCPDLSDEVDCEIAGRILKETEYNGLSSSLNLVNGAILQSVLLFQLNKCSGLPCEKDKQFGVIVFSKRSPELFSDGEKQTGAMGARLLSVHATYFEKQSHLDDALIKIEGITQDKMDLETQIRAQRSALEAYQEHAKLHSRLMSLMHCEKFSSMTQESLAQEIIRTISEYTESVSSSAGYGKSSLPRSAESHLILHDTRSTRHKRVIHATAAMCNVRDLRPSDGNWITELTSHCKPIDFASLSPAIRTNLRSFLSIPEEYNSFTTVPILHSVKDDCLHGFLSAASNGDSWLVKLSELSWMQLSHSIGNLFEQWNLLVCHKHEKDRAKSDFAQIQSEKKRLEIELSLCRFFHKLWSDITAVFSSQPSCHRWKQQIETRICQEIPAILSDEVEFLNVQLTIEGTAERDLNRVNSSEVSSRHQFVAKLMGHESATEMGVFQVSWKNGSNGGYDNEHIIGTLQWIADRLKILVQNGMIFESVMTSKFKLDLQIDQLAEQEVVSAQELTRVGHANEQFCHVLTWSSTLLNAQMHNSNDIEVYLRQVFETVHALKKPQLKLWVIDDDKNYASTVVDRVKQTRSIQHWRDRHTAELAQQPTFIDLFDCEDSTSPDFLLGVLELSYNEKTSDKERKLVTEVITSVLRHILSTRNRLTRMCKLQNQVAIATNESKHHFVQAKQRSDRIFEHIRLLDEDISKWISLNTTHLNDENKRNDAGLKSLQASANGMLLHLSEVCSGDGIMAPLVSVRSVLITKNEGEQPPTWRSSSCTCDALSCQSGFDPMLLEQVMAYIAADNSMIVNASNVASMHARRVPDPLISLVFPSCDGKKAAQSWQLVDSPDIATHQLLLVPTSRYIDDEHSKLSEAKIRLVFLCVIQGNDGSKCKEWESVVNTFARRIMDAYLTTRRLEYLSVSIQKLKDQVKTSESKAQSSFLMQEKLHQFTLQIMPLLSVAMNSTWISDTKILSLIEDMVKNACGDVITVQLRLFGDDTLNTNAITATLQQNTAQICGTNIMGNLHTLAELCDKEKNAYRKVLTLLDATKTEIGELILQFNENVHLSYETKQLIDRIAHFAGLIVGLLVLNKTNTERSQALQGDYETLLTEKAQLEVNCLEMKNHLHSGEADRSALRMKMETILDVRSVQMADFVDQLSRLTERHQLLQALTKATSVIPSVIAAQLHQFNTGMVNNILFTIAEKKSARKLVSSEKVEIIVQRCIRDSKIVAVDIDASCVVVCIPMKQSMDDDGQSTSGILKSIVYNSNPEKTQGVFVLSVIIMHNSVSDLKLYHLDRLKTMTQLTKMRIQSITQENAIMEHIQIKKDKEAMLASQVTLLETKCDDWQLRYDQHISFYQGFAEELAGTTTSLWPNSVPTIKLTEMWQQLIANLNYRLQLMLRHTNPAIGQGIQLYGVVKEGNFWFSLPLNSGSSSKQIQCISFTHIMQSKATQALWKTYVGEQMVEVHRTNDLHNPNKDRNDDKRDIAAVSVTYLPVLRSMGDDNNPNPHNVVGVMELRTESALNCAEREIIQGALRIIAPYAQWVGRIIHRKQLKKIEQRAAQHAQETAFGSQTLDIDAHANDRSTMKAAFAPTMKPCSRSAAVTAFEVSGSNPGAASNAKSFNDTESYADDDEDDDQPKRGSRINVAAGLITFLLEMHQERDITGLNQLMQHALKSIWAPRVRCGKQHLSTSHLFIIKGCLDDCFNRDQEKSEWQIPSWIEDAVYQSREIDRGRIRKFRQHTTGEHHWIMEIPGSSDRSSIEPMGYLLITGSNLEKIFDTDDEITYLPQLLEALRLKIANLSDNISLRDQHRELQNTQAQVVELTSKYEQMEQEAEKASSIESFFADIMDANSETELISLAKTQLKKMQRCSHVVFRVGNPQHKQPITENDFGDFFSHGTNQDAEGALELKNIMRLHVFAPRLLGSALLGTFVVTMDNQALPISSKIQHQLRRFASVVGMALHNLRTSESNVQQREAIAHAEDQNLRLEQENERLRAQILEDKQDRQTLQQQLDWQAGVHSNNAYLETEVGKLTSQLNEWTQWKVEEDARVASNEKTITHLTVQLEQLRKLEIQLSQSEEENLNLRDRERKLEKKLVKHRLQLKQLVSEMIAFRRKEEYDAHERVQLQTQVAVLKENQHRELGHAAAAASSLHSHRNRSLHQLRHQHQEQKQKQLQLAQELRQLAAMEARKLKLQEKSMQHQNQVVHNRNRVIIRQTTHSNTPQDERRKRADVLPVNMSALHSE